MTKEAESTPEEHYGNLLEAFDTYDRTQQTPPDVTRRASTSCSLFFRRERAHIIPPEPVDSDSGKKEFRFGSKASMRTRSTTLTSSVSSDCGESIGLEAMETQERNKALLEENSKLKAALLEMEEQIAKSGQKVAKKGHKRSSEVQADAEKLHHKVKTLKAKVKEEQMNSLKMRKSVDAHRAEIKGLQHELSKALDTIDDLESDLSSDRVQLAKVSKELKELQDSDGAAAVHRLETELRQRNDDLEVALELLQSKVEHIIELEGAIQEANAKLRRSSIMHSRRDSREEPSTAKSSENSVLSAQLRESQAECKSLKRENMMLQLRLSEQGSHKEVQGEVGLDSFFRSASCDFGLNSDEREEPVNISDECKRPSMGGSPVSMGDSSAQAELLFQSEIERFHLEDSNSSVSMSGRPHHNLCEC